MCRLSSSQYDLYRRTNSEPGRSLFAWLRELWTRRAQHEQVTKEREPPAVTTGPKLPAGKA